MGLRLTLMMVALFSVTAFAEQESNPAPNKSYGDIGVEKVLRLDKDVKIYCDLKDMPPLIGKNIPVRIKGLKPSANPQDNLELLIFLNDVLLSNPDQPKPVQLKNIERGEHFCLVADIQIDNQDLCTMLVEKKLVNKVIEVPNSTPPGAENTANDPKTTPENSAATDTQASGKYVAAKSSKVYHLNTCSHAKRIDPSNAVYFSTKEEAEASGRRPCQTCKP